MRELEEAIDAYDGDEGGRKLVADVTSAEPSDVRAIVALLEEMDRFYGAAEVEPLELRVRQVNDALFGDLPASHALLAWDDGELVGFAAYSFLWPAVGLTRSLYLKELYVPEARQRTGVGTLLMRSLFEVAVKHEAVASHWRCKSRRVQVPCW